MVNSLHIPREFTLESNTRYRRQSMTKAMRGKIERGLVELITNSDDSYHDLEEMDVKTQGKIRIEVDRKRGNNKKPLVVVSDRAEGMSREEMYEKLGTMGGRTSGFEQGKARRGLYGRGAKDIATFGSVHFESIKNDKYSHLTINSLLKCRFEVENEPASKELRSKMGIPKGNGTKVTVEISKEFIIPQHDKLADILSRFYSLRDIMSDPNREITLIDLNSGKQTPLMYKFPSGLTVFNDDISIPGYTKAEAHLKIFQHDTPFERDASPLREGILIKSASAIHDCTHLQLDSDPYSWRFTGELFCPYIDVLVREYDDSDCLPNPKHTSQNPILLIDPDRDGLVNDHPFTTLLVTQCKNILRNLIDHLKRIETPPKRNVSDEFLKNKLDSLSREISKIFEKKLKEFDEEITYNEPDKKSAFQKLGLYIIPPEEEPIIVDVPKFFTVKIVSNEPLDESLPITISSSNEEVKVRESPVYIKKLSEDKNIGSSTFALESDKLDEKSIIEVTYNGYSNVLLITVIEPPEAKDIPDGLSFDKPSYHLKINKEKYLFIWLKNNTLLDNSYIVKVTSNKPDIVIKQGGKAELGITKVPGLFKGKIPVLGRSSRAKATISAELTTIGVANTQAIVEDKETNGRISFKFEPDEEDFGSVRYKWEPTESYNLKIGARHPSIRKYLGDPIDNIYPGRSNALYHCVLVEVIAEALAFKLLEKQFKSEGQMGMMDYWSMDTNYHKHYSDFLNVCHKYVEAAHGELAEQLRIL